VIVITFIALCGFAIAFAQDEVDSNPYDLIFVNSEKAYLLRYGSTKAWIVNPSAATEADFKIGELDLSAYDGGGGVPHMNSAVIAGGRLFIAMQRLDSSWQPSNDAYVAIFDVATDEEIDTGTPNDDGLNGIPLPIRNTGAIQYLIANNTIYVQGAGDLFGGGSQMVFPSGIVSIDPDTYSVEWVIPGGDTYGNISGMSIVSDEKGYFVGYAGWGDNTLYAFNPTTGVVGGPANSALININIAGLESGAYVDKNGMLWVSDQTNARLVILDTETNEIDEIIDTGFNPIRVAFTTEAPNGDQTAVVATAAPDYSSGAHSVIAVDPVGGSRQAQYDLGPTISDITITAYENFFYRIEKFQANNITKFDIVAPDVVIWQFSTQDASGSSSSDSSGGCFINSSSGSVSFWK